MARLFNLHAYGVVASLLVASALPANAQETLETLPADETSTQTENLEASAPQEEAAPAPKKSSLSLDEIVVTAQKRKEDVQEIPFSVTAIGGETLREANVQDMTQLSNHLPNATVGATPTFSAIYVRGLGSSFNDGFEQSVGLYVDGIYMGRLSYLNDSLIDIDRVELLRGPQGTLFGKNTVAGALSVTTAAPGYEWEGRFDYLYGDRNTQRFDMMINAPIVEDKMAARLAIQRHDGEGWVTNPERGTDEISNDKMTIKGKLKMEPTDNWDMTLGLEYSEIADTGSGLEIVLATTDTVGFYQMFNDQFEGDPNRTTWKDGGEFADRSTVGINFTSNVDVLNHTFTFIGGFSDFDDKALFDADVGPVPLITWDNQDLYEQWSMEARVLSEPGDFEYVFGVFAFGSNYDAFTELWLSPADDYDTQILTSGQYDAIGELLASILEPSPSGEIILAAQSDRLWQTFQQETISYAAFGQLTGRVLPWLELVVGARVNYEEKTARIKQEFEKTGAVFIAGFAVEEYDVVQSREESNFAPKVSVKVDLAEDIMAYATIAKGFKAGGFNPFAPNENRTTYEQEVSTTYEGGIKSKLWDDRLVVNVGYFYTEFTDLQLSVLTGIGTSFFVDNAASAISKGIEWEIRFVPWEGAIISNAGGWLDARYGDFRKGPCQRGEEQDAEGFCDRSGGELARAPEFEITTMITQVFPLPWWDMGVILGADASFQTDHYIDSDLDPLAQQNAYVFINARFGILDLDRSWSLMVNGLNVGDLDIRGTMQDLPLQEGSYFGIVGPKAAWNIELKMNF
ncbi:MAG: TonB-dependent receptor [Alphaproteobacteria bacterium]